MCDVCGRVIIDGGGASSSGCCDCGEGGRLILCGGEYETAFGFVFSGFCRMNHCICASSAAISDNPSFVRQRPHGMAILTSSRSHMALR